MTPNTSPGFRGHSLREAGWNSSTVHRSSWQGGSWEAGNYRRAGLFDFSGMSIVFVVQGDVPAEDYLCRCGTAYFRKLLCIWVSRELLKSLFLTGGRGGVKNAKIRTSLWNRRLLTIHLLGKVLPCTVGMNVLIGTAGLFQIHQRCWEEVFPRREERCSVTFFLQANHVTTQATEQTLIDSLPTRKQAVIAVATARVSQLCIGW